MLERRRRPIDNRPIGEVVTALGALLQSDDTVAYVVGLPSLETVEASVAAEDPIIAKRLRVAEKLALAVYDESRPWVSRSWLVACNPLLEEYSPVDLIGTIEASETDTPVLRSLHDAADSFAASA
ncbi:MAG: hypothetical protein WC498_04305 [Candidatus Saccharimonadales bacterium]